VKEICQLILEKGGENFILTHRGKSVFRLLKFHNMSHYFTDVVTGEDGFKRKPDPEAFLHLIVKHSLDKNETLGIGDRELDIVAGKNSGINTCYLNFDNRPILTNGDFQFKSMEELFNFLK